MYRQHQIHRNLTSSEGVVCIQRLLAEEDLSTCSAVGRRVCQEFGFYDARGREQFASCMKVLNLLERQRQIVLPRSKRTWKSAGVRGLGEPVAVPVPGRVDRSGAFAGSGDSCRCTVTLFGAFGARLFGCAWLCGFGLALGRSG